METNSLSLAQSIARHAIPIRPDEVSDYDQLIDFIGDRRIVLIGEASHGTEEFYRERAQITKRLIEEKGFTVVAVEADFPDANRVHRYVMGGGQETYAEEALAGFERFPTWMWRNAEVLDFISWLRAHNEAKVNIDQKVGFFGLDLYSLHTSIDAVITYLLTIDSEAARRAQLRYSCFDHVGRDVKQYGFAANLGMAKSCEIEVIDQLTEMFSLRQNASLDTNLNSRDEHFFAEQNARLVKAAEHYYRMMFRNDVSSWNLRDDHMMSTLLDIDEHFSSLDKKAKIIIWEHNSHIGDARATDMNKRGEFNVGELVRKHYGHDSCLIGFTTYEGSVSAASEWGGVCERKRVRPGLAGSYEELFHEVSPERFLLLFRPESELSRMLSSPLLERAIGVIYRPETERLSHYFYSSISAQFDAVIHIDRTRAVEPLERSAHWNAAEDLETYPTGL